MIGIFDSSGISIGPKIVGVFSVSWYGDQQPVEQEPGDAEGEHVQHHPDDDLVDPVSDGQDGQERPHEPAGEHARHQAERRVVRRASHQGPREGGHQELSPRSPRR